MKVWARELFGIALSACIGGVLFLCLTASVRACHSSLHEARTITCICGKSGAPNACLCKE